MKNAEDQAMLVVSIFLFFCWISNLEIDEVKNHLEVNKESVLILKSEVTSDQFTVGKASTGTNEEKIKWLSSSFFVSYHQLTATDSTTNKPSIYLKRKNYYLFSKYYIQKGDSHKTYLGYCAFNNLWSFDKFINPENYILKFVVRKQKRKTELKIMIDVAKKYLDETFEAQEVIFDEQLQLL